MAKDSVFIDTKQINRLSIELKGFEKEVPGAVVSALNRTLDSVVTKIGRIVLQEYAIKAKEVKESMKNKKRATKSDLSAYITSKGHTLSLAHFPFTPKVSGTKRKVRVKIKKGDGRRIVNTDPPAFVASTGAKSEDKMQLNVFKRVGDKRLPITVLRTLSIPQMIGNEDIEVQVQEAAQEMLNKRIEHEISWRLDKVQKKIKG